jgi:thiol:disulfide interchange protein DsbD
MRTSPPVLPLLATLLLSLCPSTTFGAGTASLGAAASPAVSPVRASIAAPDVSIRPGESFAVDIILDIDPAWHIYGPAPVELGLPTAVAWDLPPGFSALPIEWPPRERFSLAGIESEGYAGKLVLHARILSPPKLAADSRVPIRASVEWLACRVECRPGSAGLEIYLPVAGGGSVPAFLLALGLAFLGGLILNLMPCVLPVVSLKALALAKRSEAGGGGRFAQGLYYAAGVLVSFWAIAALLLALRSGGSALGWGFQLQDPTFVALAALAFFLIGLSLFGVYELGASLSRLGSIGSRGGGGAPASFLVGLFATAVATPCTAPFMGIALGYALSHDAASALGVFTALALGMAAPLLAVSALPGLGRRLPRAGAWSRTFRQVLGFPMMAAAVWMAYVLSGQTEGEALPRLLAGMLTAAMGAWAWGTWGGLERLRRVRVATGIAALALVAGGCSLAIGGARAGAPAAARRLATGPSVAEGPARAWSLAPAPAFSPTLLPATGTAVGPWRPWSEDALAESRGRGAPIFVDFSARWCLSCKVNEAFALDDAAVRARFAKLGVVLLKADWTNRDGAIASALAALGRASVPLYALYVPGRPTPVILPELLSPAVVLRYLDESLAAGR